MTQSGAVEPGSGQYVAANAAWLVQAVDEDGAVSATDLAAHRKELENEHETSKENLESAKADRVGFACLAVLFTGLLISAACTPNLTLNMRWRCIATASSLLFVSSYLFINSQREVSSLEEKIGIAEFAMGLEEAQGCTPMDAWGEGMKA